MCARVCVSKTGLIFSLLPSFSILQCSLAVCLVHSLCIHTARYIFMKSYITNTTVDCQKLRLSAYIKLWAPRYNRVICICMYVCL